VVLSESDSIRADKIVHDLLHLVSQFSATLIPPNTKQICPLEEGRLQRRQTWKGAIFRRAAHRGRCIGYARGVFDNTIRSVVSYLIYVGADPQMSSRLVCRRRRVLERPSTRASLTVCERSPSRRDRSVSGLDLARERFLTPALFKGGIARVVRSSPQFATTLAVYEMLHKHFPYPYAESTPAAALQQARSAMKTTDISRIRARNALRILLDCSSGFGMVDQNAASKNVKSLPKIFRSS